MYCFPYTKWLAELPVFLYPDVFVVNSGSYLCRVRFHSLSLCESSSFVLGSSSSAAPPVNRAFVGAFSLFQKEGLAGECGQTIPHSDDNWSRCFSTKRQICPRVASCFNFKTMRDLKGCDHKRSRKGGSERSESF